MPENHLQTARFQLQAAELTKPGSATINVPLAAACEALGPQHPVTKTLQTMQTEFIRRQEAGPDDPRRGRKPAVTCADAGGDAECPLVGPIVLRARDCVDVPRAAYIAVLQQVIDGERPPRSAPPADKAAAQK